MLDRYSFSYYTVTKLNITKLLSQAANKTKRGQLDGIKSSSIFSCGYTRTEYFWRSRSLASISANPFPTVKRTRGRTGKAAFYPRKPQNYFD